MHASLEQKHVKCSRKRLLFITSCIGVLFEKLIVAQMVKKFTAFEADLHVASRLRMPAAVLLLLHGMRLIKHRDNFTFNLVYLKLA
jgi:hypothetical protein